MLKTVRDACQIHDATLDYQVAGGVESLAQMIDSPDEGKAFFEKSYLTRGMEELLREGLLRLSGQTDQALFELAQAMGGGKTHLMCALGLLAKYPSARSHVLPSDIIQRLDDTQAQVAVFDVQSEASRQARKITPVSLEGSEVYSILRKRLFSSMPTDEEIDEVAEAYAEQIKLAEDSGYLTARSLEQIADEIRATYPFHPSFKHLVALFKDNPDFRETRGLLQFAARVIRSAWQREHNDVFLIGTQHLNLNDSQVMNEVTDINRALRPAITMDIADNGNAHAEDIDANLNSDAASQVAAMILSAATQGFGVPLTAAPHHFVVVIPQGNKQPVQIVEDLGMHVHSDESELLDRVVLPRSVWTAIANPVK